MATRKELNNLYQKYYEKDFPTTTLSKWVKEGRIKVKEIPKEQRKGSEKYDYDLDSFKTNILNEDYAKKIKASKEKPKDYIGKQNGFLLIKSIVPKEEYKENYKGTLMYCQCLKCNRVDLVQVRFSYLTPNGNYTQTTCGCGKKERAFLASTRSDIKEDFITNFSGNFERFLFIHKLLVTVTDKYYSKCPIEEYKKAILFLNKDEQFNSIYNFWKEHEKEDKTYYDWAEPSLDHKIPKSRGGSNKIENLQVLTVFENLAKRDMTWEEWKEFKNKTNTHSEYFIENILKGGKD